LGVSTVVITNQHSAQVSALGQGVAVTNAVRLDVGVRRTSVVVGVVGVVGDINGVKSNGTYFGLVTLKSRA
jgi:hypothetical protein